MTTTEHPTHGNERRVDQLTEEGSQELQPRNLTTGVEALREFGSVMRLSESDAAVLADREPDQDDTTVLNIGPQHPSTHGVLRVMVELDGERILRVKPVMGYLHTGMEKTGEELTYVQGATNVTRMDYLSPLFNELTYAMAAERLLDIELPERAVWIRMLLSEINRLASHATFNGTNGMDLAAVSMMLYGFRDREMCLRFLESTTGVRMNHNFIRVGGTAADLPDGWKKQVVEICDEFDRRLDEYDTLLTNQPIWQERLQGVGVITTEEALALGATGPILRATGYAWDLRKDMPYLAYDQVDFDVVVGQYGDCFDRYAVRLNEMRESVRILRQIVDKMPRGDYRIQDKKVTPPPRARIDESMEALIHHFKLFTEGIKVPAGEAYVAVESPRGELGCYMVSDGSGKPWRMRWRPPSFIHLQCLPHMMHHGTIADAVAVISSVDPILGEVDR